MYTESQRDDHPDAFKPWDTLISRWLHSASVRTVRSRQQHETNLKHILPRLASVPGRVALAELGRIGEWCLDCDQVTGLKSATRHSVGTTARSLLRYGVRHRYIPWTVEQVEGAVTLPKITDRRRIDELDSEEIATLLRATKDPRERAILGLMLFAGLRIAEVASLRVQDLGSSISLCGANSRRRSILILPVLHQLLVDYLDSTSRSLKSKGPLFLATGNRRSRSGQLSSRSVARILSKLSERAGMAGRVHPYALRHTFALNFLRMNGTVQDLQTTLGHSSIAPTTAYLDYLRRQPAVDRVPEQAQKPYDPVPEAQKGRMPEQSQKPVRHRDEQFRELYEEFYQAVFYFFARRGFAKDECRDLVQETFINAYKGMDAYRRDASYKTWLFKIARNLWLNRQRELTAAKRNRPAVSFDETREDRPTVDPLDSESLDPQERLLRSERLKLVRGELTELPPQSRRALLLQLEGLKYREIAELLGISLQAVRSHLFHARTRLRELLGEHFDEDK